MTPHDGVSTDAQQNWQHDVAPTAGSRSTALDSAAVPITLDELESQVDERFLESRRRRQQHRDMPSR
jgi:hypothetical protein